LLEIKSDYYNGVDLVLSEIEAEGNNLSPFFFPFLFLSFFSFPLSRPRSQSQLKVQKIYQLRPDFFPANSLAPGAWTLDV
jgi:hypothetical protein